jgi:hypothetical protein
VRNSLLIFQCRTPLNWRGGWQKLWWSPRATFFCHTTVSDELRTVSTYCISTVARGVAQVRHSPPPFIEIFHFIDKWFEMCHRYLFLIVQKKILVSLNKCNSYPPYKQYSTPQKQCFSLKRKINYGLRITLRVNVWQKHGLLLLAKSCCMSLRVPGTPVRPVNP